jgi:large conductance mechanosensitive channel
MRGKVQPKMKNEIEKITDNLNENLDLIISDIENRKIVINNKIKKLYSGWKKFAFRDNIINVAIGMIIATSFKNVVKSLIEDIITPCLIGFGVGTNTENLFIILRHGNNVNITYITLNEAREDGAVTINYGLFIHVFLNLIFVSFILYLLLKLHQPEFKMKQQLLKDKTSYIFVA